MSSKGDLSEDARLQANNAAHSARPWMERLARMGYATEGAVYSLIGLLAAGAAFGTGGRATGQHGALEVVAGSPFGGILLSLIAVGFLGYALWRSVQAIADPDREGTDVKALGKRVGYGASALIYAGLAFSAVGLVFGSASEGGGTPDDWTALLLSWPLGQVLVVGIGIVVIGVGLRELYQAYKARFLEYLKLDGTKWSGAIPVGPGLWQGKDPGGVDEVRWKPFVLAAASFGFLPSIRTAALIALASAAAAATSMTTR